MTIEVVECGGLTSVQDLGRRGYERFGVPPSGPMDRFAFLAANYLVGNRVNLTGVENGVMPLRLRCWQDGLIAVCGRGFSLYINGEKRPSWHAVSFRFGDEISIVPTSFGWAEIAFSGGVVLPEVLGSRATNQRAHLGGIDGKNLQSGDLLTLAAFETDPVLIAGNGLDARLIPDYSDQVSVGVVWGPHLDYFSAEVKQIFTSASFLIAVDSDRMGYRLNGDPLPMVKNADILSEGLVMGAIQVPASGQPMIMLADRPATGGYARIGTVISADIPLLVQAAPGVGKVRFYETSVEQAQEKYRRQIKELKPLTAGLAEMNLVNYAGSD